MECSICCDKFNLTTRKKIKCSENQCQKEICKKCVEHWLNERLNITCPCCNTIWSHQYSYTNIGPSFMKKYEKIHKRILFMRECNYIPETQKYLEYEKYAKSLVLELKVYDDLIEKYSKMKKKDFKNDEFLKEKDLLDENKSEVIRFFKVNKDNLQSRINRLLHTLNTGHILDHDIVIQKIRSVKPVCPCPSSACKGYIKDDDYKCGVCENIICKNCHIELSQENIEKHICKKEDIQSIKLISKDTKPCPKCGIRIYKIDGCDQMYCVECKTAFSWKTGQIEKGRIHNPHYYEQLRRENNGEIPRETEDEPIVNVEDENDLPIFYAYDKFYKNKLGDMDNNSECSHKNFILRNKINDLFFLYNHLVRIHFHNTALVRAYTFHNDRNYDFYTLFFERFKYVKNKLPENSFIELIYKTNKKIDYCRDIRNDINYFNLTMFNNLLIFYDNLYKIYDLSKTLDPQEMYYEYTAIVNNLKPLCNKIYELQKIGKENNSIINKVYGRTRFFDFEFANMDKKYYLME